MTSIPEPPLIGGTHHTRWPMGPFGRVLAVIGGLATMAIAIVFSLLVVAILIVVGLGGYLFIRWRTRHRRRPVNPDSRDRFAARSGPADDRTFGGRIIEGEIIGQDKGFQERRTYGASTHEADVSTRVSGEP